MLADVGQWNSADDRNAVVHALAVGDDMVITKCLEGGMREQAAFDLDFLQAENVGRSFTQKPFDDADTRAHAVDVP